MHEKQKVQLFIYLKNQQRLEILTSSQNAVTFSMITPVVIKLYSSILYS